MNWNSFESGYQKYEQAFIQRSHEEFEKQPSNNKVQYLRGVYRYLLLNRLLARHSHTLEDVLRSRYIDRWRSAVAIAKFVSTGMQKIIAKTSPELFEQMRIDAMRTLYDVFPDKTVKGWQFVASAAENLDTVNDRKFWLINIRHNIILEWIALNNITVRTRSESQQLIAGRMSTIKKKRAAEQQV